MPPGKEGAPAARVFSVDSPLGGSFRSDATGDYGDGDFHSEDSEDSGVEEDPGAAGGQLQGGQACVSCPPSS